MDITWPSGGQVLGSIPSESASKYSVFIDSNPLLYGFCDHAVTNIEIGLLLNYLSWHILMVCSTEPGPKCNLLIEKLLLSTILIAFT